MDKNSGGPAFPVTDVFLFQPPTQDDAERLAGGMTLRDYFATKALVIVAAAGGIDHIGPAECASAVYEIADAMLAERAK